MRWAGELRFPYLLALTAALFLGDVIVPDIIPFADEILLALATVLLASWRKRREEGPRRDAASPPYGGRSEDLEDAPAERPRPGLDR